jgi:DNA (cytosine-5)-methyltransferase 1
MRTIELNSAELNRPCAIDLFSGCGGLTLGLKQAGFRVLSAVEIDSAAVRTYEANHKDVIVKHLDIRDLSPDKLRSQLGLRRGQLDLLAGCPPCQGFSTLRTRNGANRNHDPRNGLIHEMLRFAAAFRPKAIMMENVPRLAQHKPFRDFCEGLRQLGYQFEYEIKDAARYGVPQRRQRLILLASRNIDLQFAAEVPRTRTVRDAIGQMPEPGKGDDCLHNIPERRAKKVLQLIRAIPKDGGSRGDLPRRRQLDCHKNSNGFSDVYGRMAWDAVSPTITSGCSNPSKGRFLHPEQDRAITMREAALLQGFPQHYVFDLAAGKEAIALMIGNALPPEFIRRHALEIRRALLQSKPRRS